VPPTLSFAEVGTIVVGASVHVGRYEDYLRDWVKAHRADLERRPSFFFSVSLTSSIPKPENQAQVQSIVDRFIQETSWRPRKVALFAGALRYSQYNFVKRIIMRLIATSNGGPTDTSRDYEFTDWDAVARFAEEALAAASATAG